MPFWAAVSREFLVILLAMLPVSELRGAIIYGLSVGMGHWQVFFLALFGNLLPIIPFMLSLKSICRRLQDRRLPGIFDRILAHTRVKSAIVAKYGAVGLMLFVAVPLPGTGAWTGVLAAFIFGIPRRYALPALCAGTALAGLIMIALGGTVRWMLR